MNTNITIRVDKKTKRLAQKTLEELGLDLSTGIKVFLRNVILTQSFPLELRTKNGFTIKQEKEILKEIKLAEKSGRRYRSIDDAMDSI